MPRFRAAVGAAYGDRCVVCGGGLRFARTSAVIGLDAAHVMWFQAGGPDHVRNGLALCALHHAEFDAGAFTIEPGGLLLVSSEVCGEGADETLFQHHKHPVRAPSVEEDRPAAEFLEWHRD